MRFVRRLVPPWRTASGVVLTPSRSENALRSLVSPDGQRWVNIDDLVADLRSPRHTGGAGEALAAYAAVIEDLQSRLDEELAAGQLDQ